MPWVPSLPPRGKKVKRKMGGGRNGQGVPRSFIAGTAESWPTIASSWIKLIQAGSSPKEHGLSSEVGVYCEAGRSHPQCPLHGQDPPLPLASESSSARPLSRGQGGELWPWPLAAGWGGIHPLSPPLPPSGCPLVTVPADSQEECSFTLQSH